MVTGQTDRQQRGTQARELIMGTEWTSSAGATPGLAAFTDQAVDHVWCAVWSDDTLEMKQKSLSTISALIALGHLDELRPHVAGAMRAGLLDADQVRAVALHLAPYVGYPRARHAMVVIEEVIATAPADGTH